MRILGKCLERIVVETAPGRIIETTEDAVKIKRGEVTAGLSAEDGRAVEANTESISPWTCENCRQNYGPRGEPPGTDGFFQQFALQQSAPPWFEHRSGWYCMSCSFPPR